MSLPSRRYDERHARISRISTHVNDWTVNFRRAWDLALGSKRETFTVSKMDTELFLWVWEGMHHILIWCQEMKPSNLTIWKLMLKCISWFTSIISKWPAFRILLTSSPKSLVFIKLLSNLMDFGFSTIKTMRPHFEMANVSLYAPTIINTSSCL